MPVTAGYFTREHRTDRQVGVVHRGLNRHWHLVFQSWHRLFDEAVVECPMQSVLLLFRVACGDTNGWLRFEQNSREVQSTGFPVLDRLPGADSLAVTDHLGVGAKAKVCHDLSGFLRNEQKEIDDVLRLPWKELTQPRVLSRYTDRAGVEMALACHDATLRDEGARAEANLVGAQERSDHDIAAGADATVGLDGNPSPQPICDQCLMRFGETDLPV